MALASQLIPGLPPNIGLSSTLEIIDLIQGDQETFFVADVADMEMRTITATLKYISQNAYWFVSDDVYVPQVDLVRAADDFEEQVFLDVINRFGSLWPMGLDEKKLAYNINADVAAGALATNLRSRRLLLMTDVEGVYDKNKKLISEIKPIDAEKLIQDGTISEGMIPKIRTCINAAENGVRGVVIIDGRKSHSILFELFSDKGAGTLIRK